MLLLDVSTTALMQLSSHPWTEQESVLSVAIDNSYLRVIYYSWVQISKRKTPPWNNVILPSEIICTLILKCCPITLFLQFLLCQSSQNPHVKLVVKLTMNSVWSKWEHATASRSCCLVRTRPADCRYSMATFSRGVGTATKGSILPKLLISKVRETLDPRLH